ncbi:MAG: hypothetical protein HC890_12325 [Chloroflexaceae bacterium]|nr:hypothetical protein [Chloroflexaceae bacterium]
MAAKEESDTGKCNKGDRQWVWLEPNFILSDYLAMTAGIPGEWQDFQGI